MAFKIICEDLLVEGVTIVSEPDTTLVDSYSNLVTIFHKYEYAEYFFHFIKYVLSIPAYDFISNVCQRYNIKQSILGRFFWIWWDSQVSFCKKCKVKVAADKNGLPFTNISITTNMYVSW